MHTVANDFTKGYKRAPRDVDRESSCRRIVAFIANNAAVFGEAAHAQHDNGGVYELRTLRPGMHGITVVARLSHVETRRIGSARGTITVSLGTLTDDSGKLPFVARASETLQDGVVLKIMHSAVIDVEGERVLTITDRSIVVPVQYEEMPPIGRLAELKSGEKGINLVVAVLETELKRVGSRFVLIGTLSDESGKLPFTSWGPHLEEGVVVRIENAYVKSWNGMPTVNVSDASTVYEVDDEVPARLIAPHRMLISDLASREGSFDVIVRGDVVSIRPGSGFIERCPRCKRIVHDGRCLAHGAIDALSDFRIKALVDDGTGTMTAIIGRQPSEELCRALYTKEAAKPMKSLHAFEMNMQHLLTGMTLTLSGEATAGKYGTWFVVKKALIEHEQPAHLLRLRQRMEALEW
ncbi:MAG: hypothetical protein ACXV45_06880 [Halobacteriota archaeon]